jgi:uncharacterized membrane protein YkoI
MRLPLIPAVLMVATVTLAACQSNSGPAPSTDAATALGITTPPPVTREEAMAIAAEAAGGTALNADQETEGGELLYEVTVQTSSGRKEVEVRASDGGVVEIEPDDGD